MSDPPSDLLRASRPRHPPHRPLTELAAWLAAADPTTRTHGDLSATVTGVTLARRGCCPVTSTPPCPGSRAHGIDYAASRSTAGAVAAAHRRGGRGPGPGRDARCSQVADPADAARPPRRARLRRPRAARCG